MSGLEGVRALAIVNPLAGGGEGKRVAPTLAQAFRRAKLHIEVELTPDAGEAARMAREAADEGYGAVIAVGGDGTANEVANGIAGTQTALALYPVGTGNDLARSLGYPRRRSQLVAFLAGATRRRIDVAEANGRVFVNAAGMGIDGEVARRVRATSALVGSRLGYFLGSLASLVVFRPVPMRIDVDGTVLDGKHLAVVAANGPSFGGGMRVAPCAAMDDGLLDVVVAGDLGALAGVAALARLYVGRHVNGRTILGFRAARVEVTPAWSLPIEVDGEPERAAGLRIEVRPGALEVLS